MMKKYRTHMHRLLRGHGLILLVGFALLTVATQAAESEGSAWQLSLVPYYWAPSLETDLTINGERYEWQRDIFDPAGHFKPNMGGVSFTMERNQWFIGLSGETFSTDISSTTESATVTKYEYQNHRGELYGGYRFGWGDSDGLRLHVGPWGGLRYRRVTHRLIGAEDEVLLAASADQLRPAMGLQSQLYFSPKTSIAVALEGDGTKHNQYTLDGTVWAKFHWTKEFSLSLGYRYQDFHNSGRYGDRAWESDGEAHGVIFGIEVDFQGETTPADAVWDGYLYVTTDKEGRSIDDSPAAGRTLADLDPSHSRFLRWLDRTHIYLNQKIDSGVARTDSLIGREYRTEGLTKRRTRLEAGFHSRLIEKDGVAFELKPDFKLDAEFPNLERYAKIVVDSRAVSDVPGTDKFDEERGLSFGFVSDGLLIRKVKLKLGIRTSSGLYGAAIFEPLWTHKRWFVEPTLAGYYRDDKGVGSYASLLIMHWLKDRYRALYFPTIEYTEDDPEFVWRHNFALFYLFEGDEYDRHRSLVSRFAIDGRASEGPTRYTWTPLYYRAPLYRKWIYYEIGPEVTWEKEDRWDPTPAIKFALLSYFWGTAER